MTSDSKLHDSFESAGIHGINPNASQQKTHCPQCHETRRNKRDKSLFVSPQKGLWKCFHCDWTGGLKDSKYEAPQKREYDVPAEPKHKPLGEKIISWFETRAITKETLEKFKIFEQDGQNQKWISFPYYRNRRLVNIKKRNAKKDFRLSTNAELIFFNLDSVFGQDEIIITEGEIDCMSVDQCGFSNVVSVPNGAQKGNARMEYLDNCFEYFEGAKKFILCVDNDEAGQILSEELSRRLGREKCHTVEYPDGCKDINEVLVKHGSDSVVNVIKTCKQHPVVGINKPLEYLEEVLNYHLNGFPKGDSIGYDILDELISFREAELTVITGVPNSGKSAWLDQVLIRLSSRHGWRHGVLSREQWPHSIHMTKLVQIFSGKGLRTKEMNQDIIKSSMKFLDDHLFLFGIDDLTLDGVLEKAKQLVLRFGIKSLVIDPWNTLDHDMKGVNETEYIRQALKKIVLFKDMFSVHVFIIAHPTKIMTDSKGTFVVPNLYSISGSAHWFNMVDNGICVFRNLGTRDNKSDPIGDTVTVYTQKVRNFFVGKQGNTTFDYNYLTGNYSQEDAPFENEMDRWMYENKVTSVKPEPQIISIPLPGLSDLTKLNIGDCPF